MKSWKIWGGVLFAVVTAGCSAQSGGGEAEHVGATNEALTGTPALVSQVTEVCPGNPAKCCAPGYTVDALTSNDDRFQTGAQKQCVVGLAGRDTIAAQGGNSIVLGGPDTDTIQAANGNNFVVPGGGVDIVATGVGDDTVAIYDLCEAPWGETIDMGTGFNTLISPVPLATLQARGLTIANVSQVIIQQNSCKSDCVAQPDCSGHGSCVEGAQAGLVGCQCQPGFTGVHCENTCLNNADSDGDSVPNCLDACPADKAKTQPGVCGCGHSDVDTDKDGVPDCQDRCPKDATNKCLPGLDALPGELPVPGSPDAHASNEVPVPAGTCKTIPNGTTTPDAATLNGLFGSVANTGNACTEVGDPGNCPLDPAHVDKLGCVKDTDCTSLGAQYVCRYGLPTVCPAPGVLDQPDYCHVKQLRCGIADAKCVGDPVPANCTASTPGGCACADPAHPENCGCAQFDVCANPDAVGQSAPTDPGAYTAHVLPPSPQIQLHHQPTPPPVYQDDPDDPNCQRPFQGNCWCKLSINNNGPLNDTQGTTGSHGSGSFLTVTFKPNVQFDANVNPIPFGDADFTVNAGANFLASATAKLGPVPVSANLIDIAAGAHASRCELSTVNAHFKVLGIDFVDLFGDQPFDTTADADPALQNASKDCFGTLSAFKDAGDRAKKALRDAQTLIKLYTSRPTDTDFDAADFCSKFKTSKDLDFPAIDCSKETVESVINHYVAYYDKKVGDLATAMVAEQTGTGELVQALDAKSPGHDINFLNIKQSDDVNLLNQTFFVGPIPVNISFDIQLGYGVQGDLNFRYSPAFGLAATSGQPTQIVGIAGVVTPSASAALAVFAGVGFDVPGFAVKAGIEGQLTLAVISANLQAGAGLSMAASDDKRAIPSDLAQISNGELYIPARQFEFFADYFYDATLQLDDVLKGTLNGLVKLKAFFFSKTFRKTLLTFPSPFHLAPVKLLHGGSRLGSVSLPSSALPGSSLGQFLMQLPLVKINPLIPHAPRAKTTTVVTTNLPKLGFEQVCNIVPPR